LVHFFPIWNAWTKKNLATLASSLVTKYRLSFWSFGIIKD
jgi:hypothetical protein